MVTDTQVFGNNFTTAAAHLGCVPGINQYHTSTSAYRLVRGELYELSPGYICNAPADDLIELGRKTQGLQPWDISPSSALAALDRRLTGTSVL